MSANADRLRTGLQLWAERVHRTAVESMPDKIRPAAPLGQPDQLGRRAPGELRASIQTAQISGSGSRFSGHVLAPVIQATTTDKGSPPHVIRATRAPRLVFYWPTTGRVMYLKSVNHPGNAAQNWWHPALLLGWAEALREAGSSTPLT